MEAPTATVPSTIRTNSHCQPASGLPAQIDPALLTLQLVRSASISLALIQSEAAATLHAISTQTGPFEAASTRPLMEVEKSRYMWRYTQLQMRAVKTRGFQNDNGGLVRNKIRRLLPPCTVMFAMAVPLQNACQAYHTPDTKRSAFCRGCCADVRVMPQLPPVAGSFWTDESTTNQLLHHTYVSFRHLAHLFYKR